MSLPSGTVPARAAEWIARILRESGMPSDPFWLAIENRDLRLLSVKQLRKISNEMSARTIGFRNANLSSHTENLIFFPPKSGARKAQWISTIAMFFSEAPGSVYRILNRSSGSSSVAKPSFAKPPRVSHSKVVPGKTISPVKAKKKSPSRKPYSTVKGRVSAERSPVNSTNSSEVLCNATMVADESLASSLSQENIPLGTGHGLQPMGRNNYHPRGGPLKPKFLNSHSMEKRQDDVTDSKNLPSLPVKVKKERTPCTKEFTLQPRNNHECGMVASLREMGFTDTLEILTAIRAVAANREECSIVSPSNCLDDHLSAEWSVQDQVEAAMMWIISQREEAAEAHKLDEARISSERAVVAMEQSRQNDFERELKNSKLVDLIGSAGENGSIRSRHFPCSDLLRNRSTRRVLSKVASGPAGKDQVIRLLSLEMKAQRWYGTVLPFSYFVYVLCPCIELWENDSTNVICQNLIHESEKLEEALFRLSEQEEGGVGSVPKVFLAAQRAASIGGMPISNQNTNIINDDDIEVIELARPSTTGSTCNPHNSSVKSAHIRSQSKFLEVIDIT